MNASTPTLRLVPAQAGFSRGARLARGADDTAFDLGFGRRALAALVTCLMLATLATGWAHTDTRTAQLARQATPARMFM